jgi:hypothetical protein
LKGLIETALFRTGASQHMTERATEELIDTLARDPFAGDLIPGTGGIRKLRWGTGKVGKRGGVRIFYYARPQTDRPTYLLICMPKREDKRLTAAQKKALTRAVAEIDRVAVARRDKEER